MKTSDVLGWAALSITLVYTGLGLPVQIYENRLSASTGGLSLFMTVLLFSTFSSWVVYGASRRDWYVLLPNLVGACCSLVLLGQFWMYGRM
jgi:uncharacterized protein with PQ loop repeat